MEYGYIRVSTKEQNEDRQVIALTEAGVDKKRLVIDKVSGKNFERPGYQRLVKKLKPGDVLFIKSIDRLGRNYKEILEQWRYLTKEKGIAIVVLDMPLLDTRQKQDLIGELISDIVLQLLSYVAQTEREFIKQRQAEGIAAAKAKGVKFGRPEKELPPEFEEVFPRWISGEISGNRAAKLCNMPLSSYMYRAKKLREYSHGIIS